MTATRTSAVFPGQGSQRSGMGKDFHDRFPVCRAIFEEASDALGWDVAALCFDGNEKLNLTEYAQPCILTTEMAMLGAIRELTDFSPACYGGHSLGEYTALVAAGAMPFFETARIVRERGRLMQAVAPEGFGGMAAVVGSNVDSTQLAHALEGLDVDLANINSSRQIVISGRATALPDAEKAVRKAFCADPSLRFVPLTVSAPFHSRYMVPMQADFRACLEETLSGKLAAEKAGCVASNATGGFHSPAPAAVIDNLVAQISGPVQWVRNMNAIKGRAALTFEIGPNRPLRAFFGTIGVACTAIVNVTGLARAFNVAIDG
jgi:[acyl-carrier-protein] S-malonyltransferase